MESTKRPLSIVISAGIAANLFFLFLFSGRNLSGERVWYLIDDAMISMSYARTFAETGEMVWYPGAERVEGFTNPLWTLYMSLLHFVGLNGNSVVLVVMLTGVLCVIGTAVVSFYLARSMSNGNLIPVATGVTVALTYPLIFWSLRGMEVGVLTFSAMTLILLAMRAKQTRGILALSFIVTALSVWVRIDFSFAAFALVAAGVLSLKWRRETWRFCAAVTAGVAVGALTIMTARWFYYGDLFPNTYTLKMTGASLSERVSRGVRENFEFVPFLAAVAWAGVRMWFTRENHRQLLLFLAATVLAAFSYSIYVGGDAWPSIASRYIVVGLVAGTVMLIVGLSDLFVRSQKISVAVAAALALSTTSLSGYYLLVTEGVYPSHGEYEAAVWNEKVREITSDDAVVAVTYAGMGQYLTERETVDVLGKMDPHIAKLEPKRPFWPGHNKWDLEHSIIEQRPDLVSNVWGRGGFDDAADDRELEEVLESGYTLLCFFYPYEDRIEEKAVLVENTTTKVDREALHDCKK